MGMMSTLRKNQAVLRKANNHLEHKAKRKNMFPLGKGNKAIAKHLEHKAKRENMFPLGLGKGKKAIAKHLEHKAKRENVAKVKGC